MNDNDLQVVLQFLAQLEPEVAGHGCAPPPAELKERLECLMTGGCSDDDKAILCEAVRDHPGWIQWMAERVKERRAVAPRAVPR
jgi:hypothetical protein